MLDKILPLTANAFPRERTWSNRVMHAFSQNVLPHSRSATADSRMLFPGDSATEMRESELIRFGCVILRAREVHRPDQRLRLAAAVAEAIGLVSDVDGERINTMRLTDSLRSNVMRIGGSKYAKNPYLDFPLHTDGTFMNVPPDWVLMTQIESSGVIGGKSRLLHAASWERMPEFQQRLAAVTFKWSPPGSRCPRSLEGSSPEFIEAPVFSTFRGRTTIRFSSECSRASCEDHQATIDEMRTSLEQSTAVVSIELMGGDVCLIDNRTVLHGRAAIGGSQRFSRTICRISGSLGDRIAPPLH